MYRRGLSHHSDSPKRGRAGWFVVTPPFWPSLSHRSDTPKRGRAGWFIEIRPTTVICVKNDAKEKENLASDPTQKIV